MSASISMDQVLHLAPNIRLAYRQAFESAQTVFDRYEISANKLRLAHFMGQILHESGAFTIQFENLNYSAQRLPKVWPSRFKPKGPLDPAGYANNPEKLANEVYGGRMGNTQAGDGFRYRGRGLLQLTGKASYREATDMIHKVDPTAPDFVALPDEVVGTQWCLPVAASAWSGKGCNKLADADDIVKITRAINGGLIGLSDRREWVSRAKAVWS